MINVYIKHILSSSLGGISETDNKVQCCHQDYMEDNEFYEATPTLLSQTFPLEQTYSSVGPNYNTGMINQDPTYNRLQGTRLTNNYNTIPINEPTLDNYNVIKPEESAPVVHTNTGVREEVTDQFQNTEEHVYAAVNKKEKSDEDGKKYQAAEEEADSDSEADDYSD